MLQPGGSTPHAHAVSFYDHDADAVSDIAAHVREGLELGEHVVVVATVAHQEAISAVLHASGIDPFGARRAGRLMCLDAKATLDTFMVDGTPDPDLFEASLGAVIDSAAGDGGTVRAFGEMVALLWDEGNVTGALELESLWNDLARHRRFSLLCAYPVAHMGSARLGEVSRMCELHSEVLAPMSYGAPSTLIVTPGRAGHDAVFVPVPEAVSAVRRFVGRVLELWGEDALLSDAALVTSELATNAVRHARSSFRASIDRRGGIIRIAIEDSGSGGAERRTAGEDDLDGRGVAIIESLARSWGCDLMVEGKTVWAEFAAAGNVGLDRTR